ncbi:MAG: hypothetical protein JJT87_20225 [Halomonas sp.]|nr:hypothetical protein [Halomonas sp.]MCC5904244.1 hypothetical protein [Halomonas sp.]
MSKAPLNKVSGVLNYLLTLTTIQMTDDVRVWQAWIPASEQAENNPFTLTVDYSETLLSSNEGQSNYIFYKADAASGKKEIEPNSEESRGVSAPTRFELTVPMTPAE